MLSKNTNIPLDVVIIDLGIVGIKAVVGREDFWYPSTNPIIIPG